MAQNKEGRVTQKWTKALKEHNVAVYVLSASMRQTMGVADRAIGHTYWSGFCEIKVDNNKYSPQQKKFIRDMNRDGRVKAVGIRLEDCGTKGVIERLPDNISDLPFNNITEMLRELGATSDWCIGHENNNQGGGE